MRFAGKQVLIIGASGGLGSAYAHAFAAEGAIISLAARHVSALETLRNELKATHVFTVDLESAAGIQALIAQLEVAMPDLSIVINAAGYDVRKPFEAHTLVEIDRSLNVNLRGSILLTQALLPLLQHNRGTLVHMGGFADGRLAFPFYAADVASRAGLRGFIDSVNREIAGSGAIISYFSPNPADTDAERPFHLLWRQMGMQIEPVEAVAKALLDAVARRKKLAIMGGWLTITFARLNAAFPDLADRVILNRYGRQMRAFFGDISQTDLVTKPKPKALQVAGIILIIASFLLYGVGLLVIPFTALETTPKAAFVGGSLALGELTFWVGAAIVGSGIVNRYRRWLNPCCWCRDTSHSR